MEIISLLRLIKHEPETIKMMLKLISKNNRIFLFGTPHHGNLGDHLIAESELSFFKRYVPQFQVLDCSMRFSKTMLGYISAHIRKCDIVIISGGGWLGTEWRHNEEFVRKVIKSFPNNKIVIFPQTSHYDDDNDYLLQGAKIYSNHSNLIFCARDYSTYLLMKDNKFLTSERLFYLPDMALFSTLWKERGISNKKRKHIGYCIRGDRESSINESMREKINTIVNEADSNYVVIRTNETEKNIGSNKRIENLLRKLSEISGVKLLVTDRLHAMIMAAITDTPCIAFDNSTHKVKGVYEWIKELDYIKFLDSADNLETLLPIMLNNSFRTTFNMWDGEKYLETLAALFNNV